MRLDLLKFLMINKLLFCLFLFRNLREILFRKANILNCLQIAANGKATHCCSEKKSAQTRQFLQSREPGKNISVQKEKKESCVMFLVHDLASSLSQCKQIMGQIMHLLSRKKSRIRRGSIRILYISFLQIAILESRELF